MNKLAELAGAGGPQPNMLARIQELSRPSGRQEGPFGPMGSGQALSKEEQNLYRHHLQNLMAVDKGGGFTQPDGQVSTVLQRVVGPIRGKFYNIPSVWFGKQLNQDDSMKQAFGTYGLGYWPSYDTPEEADNRYINQLHPLMERDMQRRGR